MKGTNINVSSRVDLVDINVLSMEDIVGQGWHGMDKDWHGFVSNWLGVDNDWLGFVSNWLCVNNGWLGFVSNWNAHVICIWLGGTEHEYLEITTQSLTEVLELKISTKSLTEVHELELHISLLIYLLIISSETTLA